jgi:monothiol glutaredoxin
VTDLPAESDRKVTTDLNQKTKTSRKTLMKIPTITAYLKTSCGWSQGVRSIMRKYNLAYEDRDIINNWPFRAEMIEKSGQNLSPCVEVDGHLLVDVSGDEVEAYLLKAGLVQLTAVVADSPTDRSCDAHHHE